MLKSFLAILTIPYNKKLDAEEQSIKKNMDLVKFLIKEDKSVDMFLASCVLKK